jgi:hypothetical protein
MTFCDLQNFMLTIGEEGRPLNGVDAFRCPVKDNLTTTVPYCELATSCLLISTMEMLPDCASYLCA